MTVPMIKSIGDVPYPIDTHSDTFSPLLTAGAALGITGNDAEESAWLTRTSEADGVATIRSIHGNTVVQDGALVPVNMEGIETVGFNQWDEEWEVGGIYPDVGSNNNSATNHQRSKNYISVFPNTTYYIKCPAQMNLLFYDSNKTYLGVSKIQYKQNQTFDTPADAYYMRFTDNSANGWVGYNHDICINLSWSGRRNGEYEAFWKSQRLIDVASYFPDGMRSAGTVYDELTSTEAITRIGERAYQSGDESDATVVTDGTITHYALAEPTTVTIDPPLNMTYRTEQGGTERVMVPTGENSAPPTLVTAQGYTAESLRDAALSAIAPVENGTASTNYGVGSYLVHGGQLCKVTTAIATGESITIGTNVTATTVMAEILSLVQ